MSLKEFFNRKIAEALDRKNLETIASNKRLEEKRIADLKQYENDNSQLFNIWTNEILVNKKILEECSENLFAGINDTFFNNKGKIIDKSPKDRKDYNFDTKSEGFPDRWVLIHKYDYKPCEVTLKASYVAHYPASSDTYMGETIEHEAHVGVNSVEISIRVDGGKTGISVTRTNETAKILSIEENKSVTDKKIVLSYNDKHGKKEFSLPFPDLTKKTEIDQLKEELAEKLATLITNNVDFPFTELSKSAKNILLCCGDSEYIKDYIGDWYTLIYLVNGKEIRGSGIKENKQKYIMTK